MNLFIIEVFISVNFVQKCDFDSSNFQIIGVSLAQFYLLKLPPLHVFQENYLKAQSSIGPIFLPLKFSFLLILYNKLTMSNHSLRRQAWHLVKFFYLSFLHCNYWGKLFQSSESFSERIFFIVEIFIFANFVLKGNFQRSHFQNVALSEIFLLVFCLLRILGESCFIAPKPALMQLFYH